MKYLIIILSFLIYSCSSDNKVYSGDPFASPETKAAITSANSKKPAAKPANKAKQPNYTSMINRTPISPSGKATRFQIFRINEVSGEGNLLKKPYNLGSKDAEIVGLAVDDVAGVPASAVFLNLNGTYIPTNYGGDSSAFAKTAKNAKYNNAAFRITIPNKRFKKGQNELKVVILGENKKYKFVPQRKFLIFK